MKLDRLILKRGSNSQCNSYDGREGEIAYDKTNKLIRVYTGSSTDKKYVATYNKVPVIGTLSEFNSVEGTAKLSKDPSATFSSVLSSGKYDDNNTTFDNQILTLAATVAKSNKKLTTDLAKCPTTSQVTSSITSALNNYPDKTFLSGELSKYALLNSNVSFKDVDVTGDLGVSGAISTNSIEVATTATIRGNTTVAGTTNLSERTDIAGNVTITKNDVTINKDTAIANNVTITKDAVSIVKSVDIGGDVTANTFTATSDARRKDDLQHCDPNAIIEALNNLDVYSYILKNDTNEGRRCGVVAQQAQQYVPDIVKQGQDGYYSVDYAGLTALCVSAIQALTARVKELEQQIK